MVAFDDDDIDIWPALDARCMPKKSREVLSKSNCAESHITCSAYTRSHTE